MRTAWIIVRKAATRWVNHSATTHGAALAFFAMLSVAPLVVISIAIISLVFGENAAQGQIVEQIESLTGREAAMTIQGLIESTSKSGRGSTATLVGVGILLFGASAVFVQVQESLNMIWGMKETRGMGILDFLHRRALSFAMTVGVGVVLLASLLLSAWLAAAERLLTGVLSMEQGLPLAGLMDTGTDFAISFAVLTVLFALIFKLLPDTRIAWKDVWLGSMITAGLFLMGKYFIGYYLGQSAVASAYGAAGSFIAVILWIYYSALIFYFGAEITHSYATVVGSRKDAGMPKTLPDARMAAARKTLKDKLKDRDE
ncbi:YihY/virulence factor BrkB family protein [Phragmitibacter flavus]|uniref:YihY/virulence factor BrkB family protein n=1 Tax=Phragmitibacter flavus TaxID=2576071 RepID=A0A5R8KGW8_9BACT|nr:YihY/virulence factor BrkB family protein [Phragmitibacter flavus]TLD71215.1 YihY/virulence factor BrkB family protein [Phragmitibacter flavus]